MSIEAVKLNDDTTIDIEGIKQLIPHRYPMLMIDRLTDVVIHESATGIKNVTINEPFFQGHFPNKPVMPGVLIVEAMAQTAAALVMYSLGAGAHGKIVYFMSVADARFRKPVVPGDCLSIQIKKIHQRANVWKFEAKALVDGDAHAEALYTAMIADAK